MTKENTFDILKFLVLTLVFSLGTGASLFFAVLITQPT
jgi:hypothetical protein